MTQRNWTIRTLSTLAILVIGLIVAVNFVIDPYGEFRLIEGDYNKFKLKAEKTTALQVASKLYDGKYALVFGSSRTMLLSSDMMKEPILNFSTSIYNNPGDILALLKMLDEKQLSNITHIYSLVDINGFHYTKTAEEMTNKVTLLLETIRNLGPNKFEDAWDCIAVNTKQYNSTDYPKNIDSYGSLHKKDTPYNAKEPFFSSHFVTPYFLKSLNELSSFCSTKKIKTTFFTTPWQQPFSSEPQAKISTILNQASQACGILLNFQLHPDFTGNTSLFSDPSHLNTLGLKSFIKKLKSSKDNYISTGKTYSLTTQDYNLISQKELIQILNKGTHNSNAMSFIQTICETGRKDLITCLYRNIEKLNQSKALYTGNSFIFAKPDRLKPLLEEGILLDQEYLEESALQDAVMSGNKEMIRNAILFGAKINLPNLFGAPPLLTAAMFSPDVTLIKMLLDNGANPNFIAKTAKSTGYINESTFTLALKHKNKTLHNFLTTHYPDNILAKHSILLNSIIDNTNNSTAFDEALAINQKYYGSKDPLVHRLHLNKDRAGYLSNVNGTRTIVIGTEEYILTPTEEFLYNTITIENKIIELLEKTFLFQTRRLLSSNPKDQEIMQSIANDLSRLLTLLSRHNAIWVLN